MHLRRLYAYGLVGCVIGACAAQAAISGMTPQQAADYINAQIHQTVLQPIYNGTPPRHGWAKVSHCSSDMESEPLEGSVAAGASYYGPGTAVAGTPVIAYGPNDICSVYVSMDVQDLNGNALRDNNGNPFNGLDTMRVYSFSLSKADCDKVCPLVNAYFPFRY